MKFFNSPFLCQLELRNFLFWGDVNERGGYLSSHCIWELESVRRLMTKSKMLTVLMDGKSLLALLIRYIENWQGILWLLMLPNTCTAVRNLALRRCWWVLLWPWWNRLFLLDGAVEPIPLLSLPQAYFLCSLFLSSQCPWHEGSYFVQCL